jgi:hypothetical protein
MNLFSKARTKGKSVKKNEKTLSRKLIFQQTKVIEKVQIITCHS